VRPLVVLFLLAALAGAEGESRLGNLIRWYLREESPARRQDLLEAIERMAKGDPAPVAAAIRNREHCSFPDRPVLATGGEAPEFDLRRPRVVPVDGCAGDFAELVLPDGYTPARAYPLIVELASLGLPVPPDNVLLRVHAEAYPKARVSAEAEDLLVQSLLAHVVQIVHVDPTRVFIYGGGRASAAMAWYLALHDPDRFAGVLAGPGAWKDGAALAPNGMLFSGIGIVSHRGDRLHDAFLRELERYNAAHIRLESLGDRDANLRALGPAIDTWREHTVRLPAPRRIRLVNDRAMPMRAYWLRMAPRVPSRRQEPVTSTQKQWVLAQNATLDAQILDPNLVQVTAERVAAFDLYIDPALLDTGGVLRVAINGAVPEARVVRGDIGALLDDYRERRDPDLLYWARLTFTVR